MRLGGPVFTPFSDTAAWVAAHKTAGYSAVYVPFGSEADDATIDRFVSVCADNNLVVAEVGAWSNPISPDPPIRDAAFEKCCRSLELADRVGARCCVNIAGARGEQWDGPHRENLTPQTFDLIVESVRAIIDAVRPTRAYYTLETMPWVFPDSADSYLQLLQAIDRKQFGVHLDPVNLINCPQRYLDSAGFLRDCFAKLGKHTLGCHAKDILLSNRLTVHLDEVRPGLGGLDYEVFLLEMAKLDPDTPLMLEHLPNEEEYKEAAKYVRAVAERIGVSL